MSDLIPAAAYVRYSSELQDEISMLPEGWQKDAEFLRAALLALVAKVEVTTGGGFVVHYKAPITPDYLDTK